MNWKELRPMLRKKFGNDFYFYNDLYRSGIRRIKICTSKFSDMYSYIKCLDPKIDVNLFNNHETTETSVTIHYR